MRGNASRYPDRTPTLAQNRTALLNFLHGAREEMVLAMTAELLAQRHKLHRDHRENLRQCEALLLARQAVIRRLIEERAVGEPI